MERFTHPGPDSVSKGTEEGIVTKSISRVITPELRGRDDGDQERHCSFVPDSELFQGVSAWSTAIIIILS